MKRSAKQWKEAVEAWEASGLSAFKWCLQKQIPVSSFRHWQSKFCKKNSARDSFIELSEEPALIEMECMGVKIRISKGFDEGLLLLCLQTVRKCLC